MLEYNIDSTMKSQIHHKPGVCYKETRWVGMCKQAGTKAINHQRHTRTINVSPPMQANNATRAINCNPPTRPLRMQLTRTLHTHHTTPCATKAPATNTGARHPRSAHTTESEAPGQPPGARNQAQTPQRRRAGNCLLYTSDAADE